MFESKLIPTGVSSLLLKVEGGAANEVAGYLIQLKGLSWQQKGLDAALIRYLKMRKKLTSLLLATHNPGKIRELEKLLAGLPIELKGLPNVAGIEDVEETGSTFRENAELK